MPKDIPNIYKELFDEVVLNIKDEAERIIPFIEELGEELKINLDDKYVVIIKKEKNNEKDSI